MRKLESFGRLNLYIFHENSEICSKNVIKTIKRFIVTIGLIFTSILIGLTYPAYIWYCGGKLFTLTGVLIPFVESGSNLDFTLNLTYQMCIAFITFNGFTCIQVYTAILMDTIKISTDISKKEMKKLSDYLEREKTSEMIIRKHLKKIFEQIKRMDE